MLYKLSTRSMSTLSIPIFLLDNSRAPCQGLAGEVRRVIGSNASTWQPGPLSQPNMTSHTTPHTYITNNLKTMSCLLCHGSFCHFCHEFRSSIQVYACVFLCLLLYCWLYQIHCKIPGWCRPWLRAVDSFKDNYGGRGGYCL